MLIEILILFFIILLISQLYLFIINNSYYLIDYIDELIFENCKYEDFELYLNLGNGCFNKNNWSIIMENKKCLFIMNNTPIKKLKLNRYCIPYNSEFIKIILQRFNIELENFLLK